MYRLFLLLLSLTLLPLPTLGEAPLTAAEDLVAVYTWPENAPEAEASYVYRCTYPQFAGDSDTVLAINNTFQYEASDALGFECPMAASDHPADQGQMQVTLTYEITHMSADNLSVCVYKTVTAGDYVSHIVKAFNFSLTGEKAGILTSLPRLLGILKPDESDEWLIQRQTDKVDNCTRELVWSRIEADMKKPDSPIYPDMTMEEFEWCFYPEEDFYLDADGNLVFFIQEGMIAPPEAGILVYVITMEELLDEI
ncbi:MAG: DUF3298 domain-containing protein [Clostridia bacterium]|nr:DUF3298 domain-containing protein [Clostridia bacterium]